jgi:GNAT superfamily N-acetyltransferase
MSITVRAANEGDVELLAALNGVVHELHVAALPAYFKQPEPGAVAELFRSKLRRTDVRIWIASAGATPAGYAVVGIRERTETELCRARSFYEVDEIAVSAAHRRQGMARALLERVFAEARSQGVRDVELTSWSFNADAHAAFQALGFRPKVVRFGRESE